MATRKVGRTGRFGARYGKGVKKRVQKIESKQFSKQDCPSCGADKVKRKHAGLYFCRKCGYEFAGGAYLPETMVGKTVKNIVTQKKGLQEIRAKEAEKEMIEAGEEKAKQEEKSREV